MKTILSAVLLLAVVSLCNGLGPAWYSCDPTVCTGAKNCMCPSWTNPAGLQPADIPQIVLITHDDAVNALSNSVVRQVTDGFKNANGCNVPATWFTIEFGSDCSLIKKLHDENHEIAAHTINHTALTTAYGAKNIENQILGSKKYLASCGVPEADIKGFRSPYLIHNPLTRQALTKDGFSYDSSITEYLGDPEYAFTDTTVDFGTKRLWPYTMDNGIIQNCGWTAPDGDCNQNERYPGMWEIPMWDVPADLQGNNNSYTMDPDKGQYPDLFTYFKTTFDKAYEGSRAPYPLMVHAPWFTPERTAQTKKFVEYALTRPNTWFLTVNQLIEWMKNPVPANQMGTFLKCNPVSLTPLEPKPCLLYTVQPGDFLSLIAGKFGLVNTTELIKINTGTLSGLNPVLQPGMTLKIPPFNETCGAGIPSNGLGVAPAPAAAAQPTCRTWTVATGDFLYKIAETTKSTITDLAKINNFANTNVGLTIGQVLKVPPYPDCCATNNCPDPNAAAPAPSGGGSGTIVPPSNSYVEMDFSLMGASSTGFTAEYVSAFSAALAQLLGVPAESVIVQVTNSMRRSRQLLAPTAAVTVTAAAAPSPGGRTNTRPGSGSTGLNVQATIVSANPIAVYNATQQIVQSGQLNQTLGSQGLSLPASPVVTVYENGQKLNLPSTFPTTPTVVPAAPVAPVAKPPVALPPKSAGVLTHSSVSVLVYLSLLLVLQLAC